jgi:hypothetical protein
MYGANFVKDLQNQHDKSEYIGQLKIENNCLKNAAFGCTFEKKRLIEKNRPNII